MPVASRPTRAESAPPASPPPPKADAVDPDACRQARAELKRLEREAAVGCSPENPCLTDRDCLLRTENANLTEMQDARTAMEAVCPGAVDRLSCAESPAICNDGRCVAWRPVTPPR